MGRKGTKKSDHHTFDIQWNFIDTDYNVALNVSQIY